jgi:hypothetical protein
MQAGLVFLNAVATDGSKMRACASEKGVYSEKRLAKEMAKVEEALREAEALDRAEDEKYGSSNGRELPERLKDAASRKAALEEIGRQLKESKSSTVVTNEPEARVMMAKDGKLPCYNMQASVDTESQIIVAMKLLQAETDHRQLPEMVAEMEANTGFSPDVVVADAGYSDEATLKWASEAKSDVVMPIQEQPESDKRDELFRKECFVADEEKDVLICPAGRELAYKRTDHTGSGTYRTYASKGCKSCSFQKQCVGNSKCSKQIRINEIESLREEMRQKLKSEEGRALIALRRETVEIVFAQIKRNLNFDRFLLRGFKGACAEVALICMVHNLLKCARNAQAMAYLASVQATSNLFSAFLACIARFSGHMRQPAYTRAIIFETA